MKNALFICWVLLSISACSPPASDELPAFEQQALAATGEFAGQLKQALQTAMQEGGPKAAVAVCQTQAPEIAASLSAETGLDISRTSLKVRNPVNQPAPWQQTVLNDFEQQKQAGTPINELKFVADSDDGETLQMMKAIGTEAGRLDVLQRRNTNGTPFPAQLLALAVDHAHLNTIRSRFDFELFDALTQFTANLYRSAIPGFDFD